MIRKAQGNSGSFEAGDSDEGEDEAALLRKEQEEDCFALADPLRHEKISMIQDSRGFIYYIVSLHGE